MTDCRVSSGTCQIVAHLLAREELPDLVAPFDFDPAAQLAPPPTLVIAPDTNLGDLDVVTLSGRGYEPSHGDPRPTVVAPCLASDQTSAGCSTDQYFGGTDDDPRVDDRGDLHGMIQVSAQMTVGAVVVDCRVTACELRVADLAVPALGGRAPLVFDPTAPVFSIPTMTVTPSAGLLDGQSVHVRVAHARQGIYLEAVQCHNVTLTQLNKQECNTPAVKHLLPGTSGIVEVDLSVDAEFSVSGGAPSTVDCRAGPEACAIFVATYPADGRPSKQAISFASGVHGRRYVDRTFGTVDVTPDVECGHAEGEDGPEDLKLDRYEPHGDTELHRPVVVYIHGGFFATGDKSEGDQVGHELARRGYVVVSINYRLYDKLGIIDPARFLSAIPAAHHDAQAAIRFMRKNAERYRVAREAFASIGYSAGAITALNVANAADDPGDSGNAGFPSDVAAAVSLSGFQGVISPKAPPVLMFHGDLDNIVPYAWAVDGCQRQKAAGGECTLITYPGVDHNISYRYAELMPRVLDFYVTNVIPALPQVPETTTTTSTS